MSDEIVNKISPSKNVPNSESSMSLSTVINTSVFILLFIFIGIPLWWKTTTVYRFPISYEASQKLLNENVVHSVAVQLVIEDQKVTQGFLWKELISRQAIKPKHPSQPVVTFQWTMTSVSKKERLFFNKNLSFSALDENLQDDMGCGELKLFILSHESHTEKEKYIIGNGRVGYIINQKDSNLVEDILFLASKMVQVDRLQKLFTSPTVYGADNIPDKEKMRYLRSTQKFDITFSLIVPEPHNIDVYWNIEGAVNEYLKNVINEIQMISTVKIKSQILYMTALPIKTVLFDDGESKQNVVRVEHLSSLINPIETKLGSDTSVHPNINFVLYIPTREQTPLQIVDAEGIPVPTNAFLSPQWGGVLIYNCLIPDGALLPHPVMLDERGLMAVFLTQFRLLLGLQDESYLSNESIRLLSGPVIRKWELDFLVRKNAQEQISSSISSLSSLSQLLKTIKNIVIEDDIGQKIQFALSSTQESLSLLSKANLMKGFEKAKSAFIASDEAFFDPSLLAFLYFPEDQKYAIYIPLFLPISIPVLTSITSLWRYWQETKSKHLKTD